MSITRLAARRARFRHWKSVWTNWGYALMGVAGLQTIVANPSIMPSWRQVITFALGIILQLSANMIAPYGE